MRSILTRRLDHLRHLLLCTSVLLAASTGLSLGAAAAEPMVVVRDARIPAPAADVAALYFVVEDRSGKGDRLLEVRVPIARQVSIHRTTHKDGMSHMMPVEGGLVLPAGGQLALEPGGLHVMLMGVSPMPSLGDTVPLTLVFERAGEVPVQARVVSYADAAAGEKRHTHP